MPRKFDVVARPINDPRIPDALNPAVLLLKRLDSQGLLDQFEEAFRLGRRGGHTGKGLSALLLCHLVTMTCRGIRPFTEEFRVPLARIARVVGLVRFPSAGAISRALGRLDAKNSIHFSDAVLTAAPGFDEALRHGSMAHRDGGGAAWHVVDVDPTVKAFRQRRLDSEEERPAAQRLAPGCPGYTGAKRGELRIRSVPVAHAGLGCWLAHRMWPDNPHPSAALGELVDQTLAVLSRAEVPAHQVVFRMDGEFGSAGCLRAIQDRGAQVVARVSRYSLLRRGEISTALATAIWSQVSGARPREAADIGILALYPSEGSADEGGEPARVRVVVCRRHATEGERHGKVIGPYVYELFATTLSPEGWSAASIVELYNGRASIENRFAQEDRELALGRTFSFNPHGQAMVESLGLFLWNYETLMGVQDAGLPVLRTAPPAEASTWLEDQMAESTSSSINTDAATDTGEPEVETRGTDEPEGDPEPEAEVETPNTNELRSPFPAAEPERLEAVASILDRAYPQLQKQGWVLVREAASLRCPNQKLVFPFSVVKPGKGRPKHQVIIRPEWSACNGCPFRASCYSSNRPDTPKQIARSISSAHAEELRAFLHENPPNRKLRRPPRTKRRRKPTAVVVADASPLLGLHHPLLEPRRQPGPFSLPDFVPGEHRSRGRQLLQLAVSIEIRLSRSGRDSTRTTRPPPNPRHPRQTWSVRRRRWSAARPHTVRIHVRQGDQESIRRVIIQP